VTLPATPTPSRLTHEGIQQSKGEAEPGATGRSKPESSNESVNEEPEFETVS